jgi:hypothetical protein
LIVTKQRYAGNSEYYHRSLFSSRQDSRRGIYRRQNILTIELLYVSQTQVKNPILHSKLQAYTSSSLRLLFQWERIPSINIDQRTIRFSKELSKSRSIRSQFIVIPCFSSFFAGQWLTVLIICLISPLKTIHRNCGWGSHYNGDAPPY